MKNNFIISLLIPLLILSLSKGSPLFCKEQEKKSVTISMIEGDYIHHIIKDIVSTAYNKLGIKVEFYELPAKRSLEWANIGKTDGDLARIDNTEKKYVNLIKIPVPLISIRGVVFTKNVKRDIRSWDDMKDMTIGIRNGIRYCEVATEGFNRIMAQDLRNLFTLLSKDRIDVAVADNYMGRYEVARHFMGSNIHIIGQPLKKDDLFHYIHKSNISLVPRLRVVLQNMMESGEMDAIRERTIKRTLSE